MMSLRSSSTKKCSISSTISCGGSFVKSIDEVFRQLKLKILSPYLFQTLHDDFVFSYRIKAMLKRLNNLNTLKPIVSLLSN